MEATPQQSTRCKIQKATSNRPYIADFYTRDIGLVIEVDGGTHFTSNAQAYDTVRTDYLHQLG